MGWKDENAIIPFLVYQGFVPFSKEKDTFWGLTLILESKIHTQLIGMVPEVDPLTTGTYKVLGLCLLEV